jgi:hypothetical protein
MHGDDLLRHKNLGWSRHDIVLLDAQIMFSDLLCNQWNYFKEMADAAAARKFKQGAGVKDSS